MLLTLTTTGNKPATILEYSYDPPFAMSRFLPRLTNNSHEQGVAPEVRARLTFGYLANLGLPGSTSGAG